VGFLDTLLGRTKPLRPNLDALFTLPSAAVTLELSAGVVPTGHAGVCWKPPAGRALSELDDQIAQLLDVPEPSEPSEPGGAGRRDGEPATTASLRRASDSFGYQWLVVTDPDIESLVTQVHMVNSTLADAGFGTQLLCSVFRFVPAGPVAPALPDGASDAGMDADPAVAAFFLVYLYKRGSFYPFAPDGPEHRDTELEMRVRAVLGSDLPVEADLARWFPLSDLPVD